MAVVQNIEKFIFCVEIFGLWEVVPESLGVFKFALCSFFFVKGAVRSSTVACNVCAPSIRNAFVWWTSANVSSAEASISLKSNKHRPAMWWKPVLWAFRKFLKEQENCRKVFEGISIFGFLFISVLCSSQSHLFFLRNLSFFKRLKNFMLQAKCQEKKSKKMLRVLRRKKAYEGLLSKKYKKVVRTTVFLLLMLIFQKFWVIHRIAVP